MIDCNMYVLMLCLGIPDIDNELFKTQYFISENMFVRKKSNLLYNHYTS